MNYKKENKIMNGESKNFDTLAKIVEQLEKVANYLLYHRVAGIKEGAFDESVEIAWTGRVKHFRENLTKGENQ